MNPAPDTRAPDARPAAARSANGRSAKAGSAGARSAMALIGIYQRVMAGSTPRCRFAPSCSEYTRQAIESAGLARGGWMGVKRISRCHPWHPGGYDPVIDPNTSSRAGR